MEQTLLPSSYVTKDSKISESDVNVDISKEINCGEKKMAIKENGR